MFVTWRKERFQPNQNESFPTAKNQVYEIQHTAILCSISREENWCWKITDLVFQSFLCREGSWVTEQAEDRWFSGKRVAEQEEEVLKPGDRLICCIFASCVHAKLHSVDSTASTIMSSPGRGM